jgi:hypothetical protein
MIASHNSLTFNNPTSKIMGLFSFIWRCQNKCLIDQYNSGVRYFDIRVHRRNNVWEYCHGKTNLKGYATKLYYIFHMIQKCYPGTKCRIILEKSSNKADRSLFISEAYSLIIDHEDKVRKVIHQFIIKKRWEIIWENYKMSHYKIVDKSWVPFTSDKPWYKQLSRKIFSTPKIWAKKHNHITQEEINDPNIIYFYDYI